MSNVSVIMADNGQTKPAGERTKLDISVRNKGSLRDVDVAGGDTRIVVDRSDVRGVAVGVHRSPLLTWQWWVEHWWLPLAVTLVGAAIAARYAGYTQGSSNSSTNGHVPERTSPQGQ